MCVCVCVFGWLSLNCAASETKCFLWIVSDLEAWSLWLLSLTLTPMISDSWISPTKKISNGSATNQIIQYSLSNHRESETQSVFQIEQIHQQRQLWLWHWVLSVCISFSLALSLSLWHDISPRQRRQLPAKQWTTIGYLRYDSAFWLAPTTPNQ